MGKKDQRTNVMRVLDGKGICYREHTADNSVLDAVSMAAALNIEPERVFKTLVTVGRSGTHYVFMVPGCMELDLKKAAKAAGEKSLEMLPQKELLPLTGYVHGGCSPIGMKKLYRTFIDQSAEEFDVICFSAGKIGHQVELSLEDLRRVIPVDSVDLTTSEG